MEWIDAKKSPPKTSVDVLALAYDETIFMAKYQRKSIFGSSQERYWYFYFSDTGLQMDDRIRPTHWMPLPEPPTE